MCLNMNKKIECYKEVGDIYGMQIIRYKTTQRIQKDNKGLGYNFRFYVCRI